MESAPKPLENPDFSRVIEACQEEIDAMTKADFCSDNDFENTKHKYSYFPILIDKNKFGKTRDEISQKLKDNNIFARRYFYPLISQFSTYRGLASAKTENLPTASKITEQVLCLPLYADLKNKDIERIVDLINE